MSETLDGPDVLVYLEAQLDEATTILVRAANRRAALVDLTAAARSARHELGLKHMTPEQLLEFADRDPISAGEIRALIQRATRKEDDDDRT